MAVKEQQNNKVKQHIKMIAKVELIAYIKSHDRYFHDLYINDYSYEILLALKKIIESYLSDLPKGFLLYSNGYNLELAEMKI